MDLATFENSSLSRVAAERQRPNLRHWSRCEQIHCERDLSYQYFATIRPAMTSRGGEALLHPEHPRNDSQSATAADAQHGFLGQRHFAVEFGDAGSTTTNVTPCQDANAVAELRPYPLAPRRFDGSLPGRARCHRR